MPDNIPTPPPAEPLWSRRSRAQQVKNNAFFREARAKQGRTSPTAWNSSVKPNTTQAQRNAEPRLAGTKEKPRTRKRLMDGRRVIVGIDRTTGVTGNDRAATQTTNDRFFNAAKDQSVIEKARAKK